MEYPVLILHGWDSSSKNWSRVKELLEDKGYKVIVPDLPGFGENSTPPEPWLIDDYVEWVKDFCEKNNLSQIFLLGHSFGGSTAIKFALKYPDAIKKLFLIASSGIRKKTFRKELLRKISNFFSKFSFLPFYDLIRKIAYRTLFRRSDYLLTEGVMKETYLNVIREDISDSFSNISVPALLVWGEKDKITPLQHAYFMKEKIAGAKLEIIPNVKHNPHFEAPEILAEKILNFIEL